MAIYQRPLRPDELMHWGIGGRGQERPNHKYKERKWVNGAWQYIYDQAGGKYKKQAQKFREQARRDEISEEWLYRRGRKHAKNADINRYSGNAHSKAASMIAARGGITSESYKTNKSKAEEHQNKDLHESIEAGNVFRQASKKTRSRIHNQHLAKSQEENYKNSLAGRAETAKKKVKKWSSNTMKTAKKYINSGQKKFNNFLNGLKPKTYVTFSDGTKMYLK